MYLCRALKAHAFKLKAHEANTARYLVSFGLCEKIPLKTKAREMGEIYIYFFFTSQPVDLNDKSSRIVFGSIVNILHIDINVSLKSKQNRNIRFTSPA